MTRRDRIRRIVQAVIREHCGEFGRIEPDEERAVRKALRDKWGQIDGTFAYHPYRIWLDEISRQLAGRTGRPVKKRRVLDKQGVQPDPRQMSMFEEVV